MCFCVSVCHRMYACLCVHVKATKEFWFSYDCVFRCWIGRGFKLDSCWVPPSTHTSPQHSFVSFPFCSSLLLLPVQFLFFSSFAVSSCLFASPSFPLSLYFSLFSLSYSFSFFPPHPFVSCVDGRCSWIYGFLHGGLSSEGDQNDFTACCVEYGLVQEQGGSSKHQTTVLFWSILYHRGSGTPEIDHKVAFLVVVIWPKYPHHFFYYDFSDACCTISPIKSFAVAWFYFILLFVSYVPFYFKNNKLMIYCIISFGSSINKRCNTRQINVLNSCSWLNIVAIKKIKYKSGTGLSNVTNIIIWPDCSFC